jgi:CelD/BcsL family acetyltransferase involved in cellulose biosynthesis
MAIPSTYTADWPGLRSRVAVATPAAAAISVEVVSDLTTFLRLEAEWNAAVERAGVPHPFLRHEWMVTWWECFGRPDQRLHLIVARAQGRIVAIAPLLWEKTRIYGVPLRRLRTLDNDHTPRIDFIVADRSEEAYRAIWQSLLRTSGQWDLIQLNQIPGESPTLATLARLAAADGYRSDVWHGERSPHLSLDGTWEHYLDTRGAKLRQNLRNRIGRLARFGGAIDVEVLHRARDIQEARGDAFRLETSGWKRATGTAIVSDRAVQRFYSLMLQRGADRGWLELSFLTVDGRRIATALTARYQGRLFLVKTGYDPTYEKCAPFKILTYLTLRNGFESGLAEMDFMGDAEPWKLEWASALRSHEWLFIFPDRYRSQFVRLIKFHVVPTLKRFRG